MKKILYEVIFNILAVISVILTFIDIKTGLNNWETVLDLLIWLIFVLDYVVRLVLASESRKKFIKENIFDLIAIIPFSSAFRIFRSLKLVKLLKFTKLLKLSKFVAVLGRFYSRFKKFFNINGFKYILSFSIIVIFVGGIAISLLENKTLSDGIWWAFVTTTTVGYGDISPATNYGRIIACVLMIVGIGLIGSLTSAITSYFMKYSNSQNEKVDIAKLIWFIKCIAY